MSWISSGYFGLKEYEDWDIMGTDIAGTGNLIRFRTKAWLVLTHLGFLSLNIALMLLQPAVVVDAHK